MYHVVLGNNQTGLEELWYSTTEANFGPIHILLKENDSTQNLSSCSSSFTANLDHENQVQNIL